MLITELGMMTEFRASQPKKAYLPMLVTELGMMMVGRAMQRAKAPSPILVTEFAMVMVVRPIHSLKASLPIFVTELGMSMDVRAVQFLKASLPILVTVLGMVVVLHPTIRVLSAFCMMALQLSRESKAVLSESTDIEAKAVQPVKADQPIDVTELGMVIEVRAMQFPFLQSVVYQDNACIKVEKW